MKNLTKNLTIEHRPLENETKGRCFSIIFLYLTCMLSLSNRGILVVIHPYEQNAVNFK